MPATGENLVWIRLMAHVPDQSVVRGIEDVMQGDGQLDNTEASTEMPASLAYGVEQFQAQFIRQGFQLGFTQPAQAVRRIRAVQQWRKWRSRGISLNVVGIRRIDISKRGGSLPDASQCCPRSRPEDDQTMKIFT